MEEEVVVKEEKKNDWFKAKTVSLIGKVLAIVFILISFILKCLDILHCSTDEILQIGCALLLICSPIDLNIVLDKVILKKK